MKVVDLMDFCTEEMADQGIDIEIFDPKGNTTGIIINMKGTDSQAYLEEDQAIKRFTLSQAKKQQDFTVGMEPEAVEQGNLRRIKACFNFWKQKVDEKPDGTPVYKDTIRIGGEELPSTRKAFGELIARRGFFWVRRQVQEGMDKVTNFLPQPQPSSLTPPSSVSSTIHPTSAE